MKLSEAALGSVAPTVERFAYDRAAQSIGIVHFGIGAFHRAHQAWYTDRAMDTGARDWAITGVSLRSRDVADQLQRQDGLYTLVERSALGDRARVIGAVRRVLVAGESPEAVIASLAAPATRLASFTITEKGYCRAANGSLDTDLAGEGSVYRFLAAGLRRRHDAGLPGLTLLSCDNLAENGRQLARLIGAYLDHHDPALRPWFEAECACPATMVDRIVPATTEADRDAVRGLLGGIDDHGAVMTEPFSQWVIEDRFAGPRPPWEQAGAQLVANVAPYETAKLRLLNGAHSALAYLGLRRGLTYVHEAVGDPELRSLAERLMLEEAGPTIPAAPELDLAVYARDLLARFGNPALRHRLIQIAMDGSQKVPQRWLETLAANQREGRDCPALLATLAAWLGHVRGDNVGDWGPVDDPLAKEMAALWSSSGTGGIVEAMFGPAGLLRSDWVPSKSDRAAILRGIAV